MDSTTLLALAMFMMAMVVSAIGIIILIVFYKIWKAFHRALTFVFTITVKPAFKFKKVK